VFPDHAFERGVVGFWPHGIAGGSCRTSAHPPALPVALHCCNSCIGSGGGFCFVILDKSDKIACVVVDWFLL
jgi:hypothetical protein